MSHASKVMLKILQARLQQYVNRELPDVQDGLEKAEEPETKLPTSVGSSKKKEFQKNIYFCFIDYTKALTVWTQQTGKFFKNENTRPPYLPPEKCVCRSRSNI